MILVNFFSSFFLLLAFYNTKKETQMLGKEVKWKKTVCRMTVFQIIP